jgi:hypothetical protein
MERVSSDATACLTTSSAHYHMSLHFASPFSGATEDVRSQSGPSGGGLEAHALSISIAQKYDCSVQPLEYITQTVIPVLRKSVKLYPDGLAVAT